MKSNLLSRENTIGQAVRYFLMTATSAIITFGLPVLLYEGFGVAPQYGTAIAFAAAFVINFFSLRLMVFRATSSLSRDLRVFVVSSVVFRALEYGTFLLLHLVLGLHYAIALLLVLSGGTTLKFLWYRFTMHSPQSFGDEAAADMKY